MNKSVYKLLDWIDVNQIDYKFLSFNPNAIKNKNDFRLNTTVSKYKNRLAYKIKWDLKTNKKKNQSKSDYYQ